MADEQSAHATIAEKTFSPSRPVLITILCCLQFFLVAFFILVQLIPFSRNPAAQFYVQNYGMPTDIEKIIAIGYWLLTLTSTVGYWKMRRWAVMVNAAALIIIVPFFFFVSHPKDTVGSVLIHLAPISIGIFYYRRMA